MRLHLQFRCWDRMGAPGVDVALESADVVLVKDELAQIPYLIKLSDKTMKIAKQNIAASLVIKLILGALGSWGDGFAGRRWLLETTGSRCFCC